MYPIHLADEQWRFLAPLLPPLYSGAHSRSDHIIDNRCILEAILYKLAANAPWHDLPPGHLSYQTIYRTYHHWRRTGILSRVLSALLHDLSNRGGGDILLALQEGSIRRSFQNHRLIVDCPEHLRDTWQLNTALIFLSLSEDGFSQWPA